MLWCCFGIFPNMVNLNFHPDPWAKDLSKLTYMRKVFKVVSMSTTSFERLHITRYIRRLSRSTFRQCMTSFWWPQSPESDLYFFQNFDQKNKILSICCISYPSYVNINPPWQFPFSCHLLDFFIARLFFPRGQESQARVFLWRASSTTTKSIEHPTRIHAT